MKKLTFLLAVMLSMTAVVPAAELTVTQDSVTIEGGTYDMIDLSGRKYVTLRNVTVRNTTGENYYAAVKMSGSKYITMENCEVDGGAEAVRGLGSCGGIKLDGASRVVIKGCKIHNLNDDGIRLYTATIVDIIGNEIYNLRSCGTDPEPDCANCNNGHSDGIQIIDCIRINVIGNLIRNDYNGTSGIFMGNSGINCKDVTIANNILNTPQSYYTTYIWYQERFKMYNNVIWGYRSGGASIWYGINMWDFELVNNVVKYVKFKNGGSYDAAEHTITNNCFATAFNYGSGNLQGQDPGFVSVAATATPTDVNAAMFMLNGASACINAGSAADDIPATDYLGLGRNGAPDIGAFEYDGVAIKTGTADFTASPRSGEAPLDVSFTNTSTGSFTGWEWDFGDGGTSTSKNPSHSYTAGGNYTVSLIATGGAGPDTCTIKFYVKVTGGTDVRFPLWNRPDAPVELEVFPSPMQGKVSLESADFLLSDISLSLYDHTGREVRSFKGTGDRRVYEWDVQDLAPGVYWYRAMINDEMITGKIVKIK